MLIGPEADIRCPSPVYRVFSWELGNWREKEQIVSSLMRKRKVSAGHLEAMF